MSDRERESILKLKTPEVDGGVGSILSIDLEVKVMVSGRQSKSGGGERER